MSTYYEKGSFFSKGIRWNIPSDNSITVSFQCYISKKYISEKHEKPIKNLIEGLGYRVCINVNFNKRGKETVAAYITFDAPFRQSEVIAIANRKAINRAIKSIILYNTKVYKLIRYVKNRELKDYEKIYGKIPKIGEIPF